MKNEIVSSLAIATGIVLTALLIKGLFVSSGTSGVNRSIQNYRQKQEVRDSIIHAQEVVIDSLVKIRKEYKEDKARLVQELDSAFYRIELLVKPTITDKDKKEVVLWIQKHNNSLE